MAIDFARLERYLGRALRLRCPLCGEQPLFRPLGEVRGLGDWMTTLPGCSRCGYPYEREPGYFLISTWGINYFASAIFGIVLWWLTRAVFDLTTGQTLAVVLPLVGLATIAFVRHSKAVFLAIDRFVDPHD